MSVNGWIGVDLDGTLAVYDGWQGVEHIGEPVPKMLERVKAWIREGTEVRIVTARAATPDEYERFRAIEAIQAWCERHVGQALAVTNEKDFGMVCLWDDRAVQVIPNTGERADGTAENAQRLNVYVPCVPVAQPRVKPTIRKGRPSVFTPSTITNKTTGEKRPHPVHEFKATVKMAAREAYQGSPLRGAVRVDATFVFPRHANKFWKSKPMPRYPHVQKPDRDNCDKALLDALKGIIFADDAQVHVGKLEKWHASGDEQPHVLIGLEWESQA